MLSNPNLDLVSRFVRLPLAQQKLFYQRVQAKGMSFARLPIPQTRQEMDNLPLSYAQERQWFLWQLEPESSAYHIPTALRLRGRLDIASLQRSFAALVERHESLRTRIARMGDEWVQVVSADVSLALEVEVQRGLDEQRLLERVEAEIARPFDLEQGPLLRVTLLEVDADEHVLVMVQHHIVSDGWSMQLMVEELVQLYAAYSQGLDVRGDLGGGPAIATGRARRQFLRTRRPLVAGHPGHWPPTRTTAPGGADQVDVHRGDTG